MDPAEALTRAIDGSGFGEEAKTVLGSNFGKVQFLDPGFSVQSGMARYLLLSSATLSS